jgi:single-strand DNA-binding protein
VSINTTVIQGRLTRDPELRHTPAGTSVVKFGIAHNERRKQNEEWVDVGHFFDCTAWSGYGELLARKLRKGDDVVLSGRLSYSSWEAQDGTKRSRVEIVVDRCHGQAMFRKDEDVPARDEPQQQLEGDFVPTDAEDDIPF